MTKPNPPIKGHTLIGEGHVFPVYGDAWDSPRKHSGGCSCGAVPPEFPNVSTAQMKRWHRQHKEELRATMSDDEKLTPERVVRLLRAKAGELENYVLHNANTRAPAPETIWRLTADIALIAQLLADHIEANQIVRITGPEASGTKYSAAPPLPDHVEDDDSGEDEHSDLTSAIGGEKVHDNDSL